MLVPRLQAMSLRALSFDLRRCASNCLFFEAPFVRRANLDLRERFSHSATSRPQHADQIQAVGEKGASASSPRWLSDLKARIGKCISFGLLPEQVRRAGNILEVVSRDWRDLVAGSEGFLTGQDRAGLEEHRVVWGEMDSMQHVNNVTYTRYAESARIQWAWNFAVHVDPNHKSEWRGLWAPSGDGLILRSIRTDYKFPMTWPDKVSVYHKLRSPPSPSDDSFILDVIILFEQQQRAAARCEEDIVIYDYKKGNKTPMRPFMLEAFKTTFELQEQARAQNSERILELLRQVETLEKESWDRKDAQEDFGHAA